MQQNELLVKRYLKKGDLYVHAELSGAASVIVKNHIIHLVPPSTLEQAGAFAVCLSQAWDVKVATNAWWVYHDQVSKSAPTGEYLSTGSFMIRGKKHFLPTTSLVLGFGIMFRLEEASLARHYHDRRELRDEFSQVDTDTIKHSGPDLEENLVRSSSEEIMDTYPLEASTPLDNPEAQSPQTFKLEAESFGRRPRRITGKKTPNEGKPSISPNSSKPSKKSMESSTESVSGFRTHFWRLFKSFKSIGIHVENFFDIPRKRWFL